MRFFGGTALAAATTIIFSGFLSNTVEASTLTPPVLPLIVRNPYLSAWLPQARGNPWEHWPVFYTGQEVSCDYFKLQKRKSFH
jgi:hypothetical protein